MEQEQLAMDDEDDEWGASTADLDAPKPKRAATVQRPAAPSAGTSF
jgi:hypothetical protein